MLLTFYIVKLELRKKHLTFAFLLALTLAQFLFIHLLELIFLSAHMTSLGSVALVWIHKLIEMPVLVAFWAALFMVGKRKACSLFLLFLAIAIP